MPAPKFQLIFDSRQVAPGEHDALKARLQTRLGLDTATLGRLFSGRPVVIRRNLSEPQVQQFSRRLEALGAPCRISAQPTRRPPLAGHLSDSLVVCPKCQHSQSPVAECSRCGLIFSKYRPGKSTDHEPVPVETEKRVETDPAPEEKAPQTPPAPAADTHIAKLLAAFNSIKARLEAPFRQGRDKTENVPKGPQAKGLQAKGLQAPPYLQVVSSQGLRAILYAFIALILLMVGMWFARGLWMLYTATQVGERFIKQFPAKAQAIVIMLDQHTLILPLAAILVTLMICTAVATVAQFLHLGRYLYQNRPWWWRLLLWYLPLTVAAGMLLHHIGLAPSMKLGGALTLLPTLCLAPVTFDLGQALICEVGDLLARLRALLHHPMGQLRDRIASHLNR